MLENLNSAAKFR